MAREIDERSRQRPASILTWLAILLALPELALQAADHGLIGSARCRPLTYQNFAFWSGLLHNWRPNYPVQPYTMFLTYSVLHGGFGHLLGNIAALYVLGPLVTSRVGPYGFVLLWVITTLGGAAAFGALSLSPQPMVGASGALFGLAGAWLAWEWQDARLKHSSLWPVILRVLALVILNVVLWVAQGGLLAWETHLGGFLAGWLWAMYVLSSSPEKSDSNGSYDLTSLVSNSKQWEQPSTTDVRTSSSHPPKPSHSDYE